MHVFKMGKYESQEITQCGLRKKHPYVGVYTSLI